MAAIVHARRAVGVVAFGELADPVRRIAGDRGHRNGGVALTEQPEDLPPAALVWLFRHPIAALQFVEAQVSFEMNLSGHAPIVQPPRSKPYDTGSFTAPVQLRHGQTPSSCDPSE